MQYTSSNSFFKFIPFHYQCFSVQIKRNLSWSKHQLPTNRPLSRYSCSAKVWLNTWIKHTTGKNKPSLVSAPIFRVTDQSNVKCHHFENCTCYKVLYGERARLAPIQLICHTKPYNNHNFQIEGALQYFGVWRSQLVHLLILVCSFQ